MQVLDNVKKANQAFLLTLIYICFAPYTIAIFYMNFSFLQQDNMIVNLAFTTVYITIIPVAIYFIVRREKFLDVIPLKAVSLKNLLYIFLFCITIQPFMSLLALFGMFFSENYVSEVATNLTKYPMYLSVFAIGFMPAVCEEFLMRGVILRGYEGLSLKNMAIINGLFFGIFHGNLQQFFYAAALGFVFVYFVKLTGSILSSVFAHFVINGSQMVLSYTIPDTPELDVVTIQLFFETLIFAIPFLLLSIFILKKFIKNNREKYIEINETNVELERYYEKKMSALDINFLLVIVVFCIQIFDK